jgi:hypothetical protein
MSLMTGLVFARFARPNARLLFADNPVISNHEGQPTLMVRFANERHNIIANATAKLWLLRNVVSKEGQSQRKFYELALVRNEHPALTSPQSACHLWLWSPDMTLLRRKPCMPEGLTIIPTSASASVMPIFSMLWKMAGSELTTASSMRLWTDSRPAISTFSGRCNSSVLVYRFRSPHHCCRPYVMRNSESKSP